MTRVDAVARGRDHARLRPHRAPRARDRALRLRHVPRGRSALPAARGTLRRPPHGHERPVDRRPLADHLGHADGAEGGLALALRSRSRSASRSVSFPATSAASSTVSWFCSWTRSSSFPSCCSRSSSRSCSRTRSGRASSPRRSRSRSSYVPLYFRVVRNHTISIREEPFVEAARALGAKPFTIIRKYVFFNVVQNVPPLATLNAADAILTLAALGFLGYGIQPTDARRVGLRHPARRLRRRVGDLVDGAVPGARHRPARHRPHAARRGAERDDQSGARGSARRSTSTCGPRPPTQDAEVR